MYSYHQTQLDKEYRNRTQAKVEKQRLIDEAKQGKRSFNPDALTIKAIMTVFTIIALFLVIVVFSGQTYASSADTPIKTIDVVGDNQEGHSPKTNAQIAGWTLYPDFEQLLTEMSANGDFPLHDSRILTEPSMW